MTFSEHCHLFSLFLGHCVHLSVRVLLMCLCVYAFLRYKAGGMYEGTWADGDKNGKRMTSADVCVIEDLSIYLDLWLLSDKLKYERLTMCNHINPLPINECVAGSGVYEYPSGDVYDGLFLHGNERNVFARLLCPTHRLRLVINCDRKAAWPGHV